MERGQGFIKFIHKNWWILLLSLVKLFRVENNFSGSFFSDIIIIALVLFGAMYLYWTIFYGAKNFKERFVRDATFALVKNSREKNNFIKNWIYAFVGSNENFLLTFFKSGNFKQENVSKIFKLMGGFYLYMFLVDEKSSDFLESNKISKEDFEDSIISIFDFNNEDRNEYKKMTENIKSDLQSFFSDFYKQLTEILGVDLAAKSNQNFANPIIFPQALHNAYSSFLEILTNIEQNK